MTRQFTARSYSTVDVIEYLAYSAGKIVEEHPGMREPAIPNATSLSSEQRHTTAQWITGCVNSIDSTAGSELTAAFNAADPVRIDRALVRLDAAARRWQTAPQPQGSPCPPPPPTPSAPPSDSGSAWWKVTGLVAAWHVVGVANAAAAGVAVTVAAAINAVVATVWALIVAVTCVLVPVFVLYQFENTPSDLDRQIAIAKIATALRS